MSRKNLIEPAFVIATMFILILASSLVILKEQVKGEGEFYSEDKWDIVNIINGTDYHSSYQTNNKEIMVWNGDDVYLAYIKDEGNDNYSSMLTKSTDGGENWSEPVVVFSSNNSIAVRAELLIHDDHLYYANMVVFNYGNYYVNRRLDCMITPIASWNNESNWNKTRMDSEMPGYVGNSMMVGVGDDVILFWQRSHLANTAYRTHSNGTWSNTSYFLGGRSMGWPVPIVSDISGEETLFVYFTYYPEDSLTMTTSLDGGKSWTDRKVLFYDHNGAFNRLSVRELNDKLHLIVNNRWGDNVFYSGSNDGYNWASLRNIANFQYDGDDSIKSSLSMGVNKDTDSIFVTFDNITTIEVHYSGDNGTTFEKVGRFGNNTVTARASTFGERCRYLIYNRNGDELVIRELVPDTVLKENGENNSNNGTEETAPSPENETDPTQENDTEPDENQTEQDPGEKKSDEGSDQNETWEEGTNVYHGNNPPTEAEIESENESYQEGNPFTLRASAIDPDKVYGDTLTYEWYIEGMGKVGTGEEIELDLESGIYSLKLVVTDSTGRSTDVVKKIEVNGIEGTGDDEGSGEDINIWMIPIVAVLILLIIAILSLSIYHLRRRRDTGEQPRISLNTFESQPPTGEEVVGGKLDTFDSEDGEEDMNNRFSGDLVPIMEEALGSSGDISKQKIHLRKKARRSMEGGSISKATYMELEDILK